MKQAYLETFGCQMNVADTDRMELLLFHSGYARTPCKEEADLILVNTCSIREKAEHKIFSLFGGLKSLKDSNPRLMLGLTGCLAQQEGNGLLKRIPYLDFILGPDAIENIGLAIESVKTTRQPLVWAEFDKSKSYSIPPAKNHPHQSADPSSFVNIIKGCDKICTFCIVPFTRGREKSREAEEIYAEVRGLVERGAREIVLLGQNVNAYGKRGLTQKPVAFHELLRGVAEIPGVRRLRFTTSYPRDFTREIIAAYRNMDVLMKHLHLPVQCGSNHILKAMRRGHTVEEYIELIDALKSEVPDMGLSTDIIVGFPGETEEDFQGTLRLMERIGFDSSYMFAYSPRPGTQAAEFADNVSDEEKRKRLQTVIDLQKKLTERNGQKFVGGESEVLIEGESTRHGADFHGRNPQYWNVSFTGGKGVLKSGDIVKVRILEVQRHVLKGVYESEY